MRGVRYSLTLSVVGLFAVACGGGEPEGVQKMGTASLVTADCSDSLGASTQASEEEANSGGRFLITVEAEQTCSVTISSAGRAALTSQEGATLSLTSTDGKKQCWAGHGQGPDNESYLVPRRPAHFVVHEPGSAAVIVSRSSANTDDQLCTFKVSQATTE